MTTTDTDPGPGEALDRLAQVLDHHLARCFDQLQAIADRLGDIADRLERQRGNI